LARAGFHVTLLGRDSPHFEAIRSQGLTLQTSDNTVVELRLNTSDEPRTVSGSDMIVILVKTVDTEPAIRAIAPYVRTDHVLVTMQNGLDAAERIHSVLGNGPRILPAVTWQAATRLGPGIVRHAGLGPTAIGYRDGSDENTAKQVADVFSAAGLPAFVESDIDRLIWQKAAINAAINGLTALSEVPNGRIATDPRLRRAAETLADEVASVARANGVRLGPMGAAVIETAVASAHNRSSMLQDLDAGRCTEVEAIHEAVLHVAATRGVSTPTLDIVTALIRAKERSRQETRNHNEHARECAAQQDKTDRS
jgi:2-dehydropantoate 2-reductase